MKLKDFKRLLDTATENTEISIENGEIVISEPKPIEYKFNIGDKVRNTTTPEFRYTVKERHSIDGQVVYMLEHELGGETPLNEKYLELIPRDITDRIKTFYDAYKALGSTHPLCEEWDNLSCDSDDLIAYYKLRIITAALNEGWEPQFTEGEERWYPWLVLYSAVELAEKSEEWKAARVIVPLADYRVAFSGSSGAHAVGGVSCASVYGDASYSYTYVGSRLTFRSESLANYAARQFASLWTDFYLIHK